MIFSKMGYFSQLNITIHQQFDQCQKFLPGGKYIPAVRLLLLKIPFTVNVSL